MSFIHRIVEYLSDIATFWLFLYLDLLDWPDWTHVLADFAWELYEVFGNLSMRFDQFSEWLHWARDEIDDILSWSNIRSEIKEWLDGIEDLVDWFVHWFSNVIDAVELWWDTVIDTVKGWISIAVQGLDDLVEAWENFWNITWPEIIGRLSELRSLWDNFVEVILPGLLDLTKLTEWWNSRLQEVDTLINSKLTEWLPFYDELASLWEEIKAFFASPLDWLEGRFTDWFLGPEV